MGVKCCAKGEGDDSSIEKVPEETANPNAVEGRAQWSSPTEFLLTCIGYSVGLGNVWRFPYLCYKSGGGAFLIPYIIMMCLIGMPLLFMEYSFGQYFGVGGLTIYKKVCPMFKGVGIAYMVLNGLVCIYYNVIIAMALYYLFASFTSELPWASCGHSWNTPNCGDPIPPGSVNASDFLNGTNSTDTLSTTTLTTVLYDTLGNATNLLSNATGNQTGIRTSPSDEYFRLAVLGVDDTHSIENLGEIRWHLCLCLLLAWILVILFVSRGIKSTGKVAYFTATFPYLMLTVLVIRGVTLPGAAEGILYFVSPRWEKLAEPGVWFGAASQLFYSTNLAWGGMITMSSYSQFNHNCYRDAIMINIVSFCTSLYAGFAVFSIIGYMANEYGIPVDQVINSGPGLAFIVYPRALSLMPLAPMWSALFFFMLFLLGIGSQMVDLETVMSGLCDEVPILRRHRFKTLLVVSTIFFFLGIAQVTQGGMFVLQLMDWYSASFSVLIIAVVECLVINWVYGNERFASNVKEMLGFMPGRWWRICWKFISPVIIVGILIFSFVEYKPAEYGTYTYPAWADFLGWCLVLAAVVPIFAVAGYKFGTAEGSTFKEKWREATKPQLNPHAPVNSIEEKDLEKKLSVANGDIESEHGQGEPFLEKSKNTSVV